MKRTPPKSPVIAPTGIMVGGAIVRAMKSERRRKIAPVINAVMGSRR